jgi:hypothetical protein
MAPHYSGRQSGSKNTCKYLHKIGKIKLRAKSMPSKQEHPCMKGEGAKSEPQGKNNSP